MRDDHDPDKPVTQHDLRMLELKLKSQIESKITQAQMENFKWLAIAFVVLWIIILVLYKGD